MDGTGLSNQAPITFVKNSNNSFIATSYKKVYRISITGDTTDLKISGFDRIQKVKNLSDGNFLITGRTNRPRKAKIVKVDSLGVVLWSHELNYGAGDSEYHDAYEKSNGEILASFYKFKTYGLVKLNFMGDTIKVKTFAGINSFGGPSEIIELQNGNYLVGGHDDDYPFVFSFDNNLDTLWSFNESIFISFYQISMFEESNKDILLMAGRHRIYLDSNGTKLSDSLHADNNSYNRAIRTDSGFIAVGRTRSGSIVQATKLNAKADSLSTFYYNPAQYISGTYNDIIKIDSGCYAAIGYFQDSTSRNNNFSYNSIISYFGGCSSTITKLNENKITSNREVTAIYPNPNNGTFKIDGTLSSYEYQLLNSNGKLISRGISSSEFQFNELPKGIYYIRLFFDQEIITKKLLISN